METNLPEQVLPRSAVALDGDGAPWYPFRPTPNSPVLFLQTPVLTIPGAQWADCPPEYLDRPHVDLDERAVAELLYFSEDQPTDPDEGGVATRLSQVLARVGSDIRTLNAWLGTDYGFDMIGQRVNTRMQQCRAFAHRIFESAGPTR